MDVALFSPDYFTARRRFLDAATALGCALETYAIEQKGPNGEDLNIDVAMSPENIHGPTFVISSGIHGVEGYFGSAVQLGLLQHWAALRDKAPTIRWVMLHALNPYGFAWRRRVNEQNADLNRNLLLHGESFAGSPEGYAALDGLLNPASMPSRWEPITLKLLMVIARHGIPTLKQAIASGQYEYPRGLFYGGNRPSRMSEILEANFDRWLGDSKRVVHLDLHTGLGKWGTYKLLIDHPIDQSQRQCLNGWVGPTSFEVNDPKGVAYATRGSFGCWGQSHAGQRDYLYAAAEFGTHSVRHVLTALRAENQCHHWGKPDDVATQQAKQRLVEAFCPHSKEWRALALEQAHRVIERIVVGPANPNFSPLNTG